MSAEADAIRKAAELMGEHFEAFLIVGLNDVEEGGHTGEAVRIEYGGGQHTALGLAKRAEQIFLTGDPGEFEPDKES